MKWWRRVPQSGDLSLDRQTVANAALALSIAAYIATFGALSLQRHRTFGSNALDLGYTDNAVWNTRHGRPYRFTTYVDANFELDIPLTDFKHVDNLLAYHVEPLLAPVSLLYLIYEDPRTLLLLQTVLLALGAVPAFWLARDRLGSCAAGLVFALAYLLSPSIQAANLSDFHTVAFSPTFLLFAFTYAHQRRYRPYLLFAFLALMTKEDISLLVFMLGLYVILVQRQWRVGALTLVGATTWFVVAMKVILPHFNGLGDSAFLVRYAALGSSLGEIVRNVAQQPHLVTDRLTLPENVTYLRGLLANAGFLSLLAPHALVLGGPVYVVNALSDYPWMHSEGGHYSASIIAFVIIAGTLGLSYLLRLVPNRGPGPPGVLYGLLGWVLVVSLVHQREVGVSPLARDFRWPQATAHHRLARKFIDLIPPNAPLSAQSGLYPHVSHRDWAYLFPTVSDADYIWLDVTASPYPLGISSAYRYVQDLLEVGGFGVLAAEDGYILLQRDLDAWTLPPKFYTFAYAQEGQTGRSLSVRFGDALELVGYDAIAENVVNALERPLRVRTYWRVLGPVPAGSRFAFIVTNSGGLPIWVYADGTPTEVWYPPHTWPIGRVIVLETPVVSLSGSCTVGVAVTSRGDVRVRENRLHPVADDPSASLEVLDDGTVLKLFSYLR